MLGRNLFASFKTDAIDPCSMFLTQAYAFDGRKFIVVICTTEGTGNRAFCDSFRIAVSQMLSSHHKI
jgi:hypothetical protein